MTRELSGSPCPQGLNSLLRNPGSPCLGLQVPSCVADINVRLPLVNSHTALHISCSTHSMLSLVFLLIHSFDIYPLLVRLHEWHRWCLNKQDFAKCRASWRAGVAGKENSPSSASWIKHSLWILDKKGRGSLHPRGAYTIDAR